MASRDVTYSGAVTSPSSVTVASGVRLSFVDRGSGADAVLLLPGPTDSWRSYAPTLDRLSDTLRVIAVSQRGHGDSDKPTTGYRVGDFAADAIAFLDATGVERAVVVGHSGSCFVARRVALDAPERVAGVVLEASPTTLRSDPSLQEFVESVVSTLTDPIDPAFARSIIVDTSTGELAPELIDELTAELLKVPARVWKAMFSALLDYDDLTELGQITAPTLLAWGDADPLVPRAMQDVLLARINGARLATYPGVAHTPRWEAPDRFADDLQAFAEISLGRR